MSQNGQVAAAAIIQVALLPNGNVVCQAQCPGGRPQFNMMMATALQDVVAQMMAKEQGPKIEVAPPGLVVH